MRIRWLGCAAFSFEHEGRTLLVDPFATRPPLWRVGLGFAVKPAEALLHRFLPRAHFVVCGHTHYDHALDAPAVARRDGAVLVGSATLAHIARASGVPAGQVREVPPSGGRYELGPFTVTMIPGTHGPWLAGRYLWPGCLEGAPRLPMRASAYVDGGVFSVLIEAGGERVLHQGSAGLVEGALEGVAADTVLACLAGRRFTPRYLERLQRGTGARRLVATHFDDFFRSLDEPLRLLPGTGIADFAAEVRALGAEPVVPELLRSIDAR